MNVWPKEDEKKFQEILKKHNFRKDDYTSFGPKKYYLEPENEEELKKELDALNNEVTSLPYADELPKFSARMMGNPRQLDEIQNAFAVSGAVAYLTGRLLAVEYFGDAVNDRRIRIMRFKCFGLMMPFMISFLYTQPIYSQNNIGVHSSIPMEIRMKNEFATKLDLYKNVQKNIYEDDFPTYEEYNLARNRALRRTWDRKIKLKKEREEEKLEWSK